MTARASGRSALGTGLAVMASLVLIGCDDEGTSTRDESDAGDKTNTSGAMSERSDSGSRPSPSAQDGGKDARGDAATAPASCAVLPIPETDLQRQAQGASVFGQIVGDRVGLFDALGLRVNGNCGVADVRVCLLGTSHCTESDAAGQFVLSDLPEDERVQIELTKEGLRPTLRVAQLAGMPINLRQTRMLLQSEFEALLERSGVPYDPEKGTIVAVAIAPGEAIGGAIIPAGVRITLQPDGPRPVYSLGAPESGGLSSDQLDPSLEATRFGGWALFTSVEPGMHAVRFEREGTVCGQTLPGYGYGVDDDGHVLTEVLAAHHTAAVAAFCP